MWQFNCKSFIVRQTDNLSGMYHTKQIDDGCITLENEDHSAFETSGQFTHIRRPGFFYPPKPSHSFISSILNCKLFNFAKPLSDILLCYFLVIISYTLRRIAQESKTIILYIVVVTESRQRIFGPRVPVS